MTRNLNVIVMFINSASAYERMLGLNPEAKLMTYNFLGVSGHNLESSETWGFCMDFLNQKVGGIVFYQVFFFSPLECTVTEL